MLKKLLIPIAVLALACIIAVNILSKKAPEALIQSLEKALRKKIAVEAIEYHFPTTFELAGFEIKESGRFEGEIAFHANKIRLVVSPLSISSKTLILNAVDVENAKVTLRKFDDNFYHAFSDAAAVKAGAPQVATDQSGEKVSMAESIPLRIERVSLKKSNFQFVDYDARESGFVILLDEIDVVINNIDLPFSAERTLYKLSAKMPQGRGQKSALFKASGWTRFGSKDTEAQCSSEGVFLPYFEPYYRQITPAVINNAFLDLKASLEIKRDDLSLTADLGISELYFAAYEEGDELFGLKANEILSFLKDRSGRLKFQIAADWNIAGRSQKPKDVIRRAIEKSLKKTVIGNVGNLLENVLLKFSDSELENKKESLEDKVKKLKDFLKY